MKLREWEKWWQGHAPRDFLRYNSGPESWTLRRSMFEMVADIAHEVGGTTLDVGCATCVSYPYFKERGMKYTGLDLTKKFLDYARELHPEIDVCLGNIVDRVYPDDSFDTVMCINTFTNFNPSERHEILNQLIRIARKQVLIVFEKEPWDKPIDIKKGKYFYTVRYNKKDLINEIENNGKVKDLKIIKIEDGKRIRSEVIYKIIINPNPPRSNAPTRE